MTSFSEAPQSAPKTRPEIEVIAEKLSRQGRMPVDVHLIARSHGLEVVESDLEDTTSGMLVRRDDGAAFIVVNKQHHPHRKRFTIAHELGHFFLHRETATVFVDGMRFDFRAGTRADEDPREREASVFAAVLLMPEAVVRAAVAELGGIIDVLDDGAIEKLSKRFKTSAQALVLRLDELGLLAGHR